MRSAKIEKYTLIFRGFPERIGVCAGFSLGRIGSVRLGLSDFCSNEEIVGGERCEIGEEKGGDCRRKWKVNVEIKKVASE